MKHFALFICQRISEKHLATWAIYTNVLFKTWPDLLERMEQEHKPSKPKKKQKYQDFLVHILRHTNIHKSQRASLLLFICLVMPAIKSPKFIILRPGGEKQHLLKRKNLDKFKIIILNNAFASADFYLSNSGCQHLKVPSSHYSKTSIQCRTQLICSLFRIKLMYSVGISQSTSKTSHQ